jgi:hypothetical protein
MSIYNYFWSLFGYNYTDDSNNNVCDELSDEMKSKISDNLREIKLAGKPNFNKPLCTYKIDFDKFDLNEIKDNVGKVIGADLYDKTMMVIKYLGMEEEIKLVDIDYITCKSRGFNILTLYFANHQLERYNKMIENNEIISFKTHCLSISLDDL